MDQPLEVLTAVQSRQADALAIASGVAGIDLMEAAGRAVFEATLDLVPPGRGVLVACGPGNNGGDGFVAARLLREAGHRATVALAGDAGRLRGDAALAFGRWGGPVVAADAVDPSRFGLVVDALLGAGLDRDVEGPFLRLIDGIDTAPAPVVAVDLPSGLDADTGLVRGRAARADRTVTFFRKKPAHLLFPGRALCGALVVADIGIPASVLDAISPATFENGPALWRSSWPRWKADGHKYDRGHALVVSGGVTNTGAARLAARAALRVGAGLATVASPPEALLVNAAGLAAVMVRRMEGAAGLADLLADRRINAIALGPALGVGAAARDLVAAALAARRRTVLDADALTSFDGRAEALFELTSAEGVTAVLTPHGGEFARLFPDAAKGKLAATRAAAAACRAVVVHKGADTVIAAPDGRAAINGNAPPWLGTAGSGDVLAGMIAGLLARGMPAFEAACAGVWLHGRAGAEFGPGLIAEDIEGLLPRLLQSLENSVAGEFD